MIVKVEEFNLLVSINTITEEKIYIKPFELKGGYLGIHLKYHQISGSKYLCKDNQCEICNTIKKIYSIKKNNEEVVRRIKLYSKREYLYIPVAIFNFKAHTWYYQILELNKYNAYKLIKFIVEEQYEKYKNEDILKIGEHDNKSILIIKSKSINNQNQSNNNNQNKVYLIDEILYINSDMDNNNNSLIYLPKYINIHNRFSNFVYNLFTEDWLTKVLSIETSDILINAKSKELFDLLLTS